jgi:hypothetical protein
MFIPHRAHTLFLKPLTPGKLIKGIHILIRQLLLIAIKYLSNFLERRASCFNVKEAHEDEFEEDPHLSSTLEMLDRESAQAGTHRVDGIELPCRLQVLEPKRIDPLVERQCGLDEDVHHHKSLCTNFER